MTTKLSKEMSGELRLFAFWVANGIYSVMTGQMPEGEPPLEDWETQLY